MVISDRKNKLIKSSHRILLLMSIFDIMQSSACTFSSMAIPKNPDYPGSMGNETTCTIQGFFLALGLAVPLYNSSLNSFFLLSIRYKTDPKIFSRKVEPYLHAFSIFIPLIFSITFTVTGKMKPIMKAGCVPATRAGQIFFTVVIVICILVCLFTMCQICWTVISQKKSMDKYVFRRVNNQSVPPRSKRSLTSNDRETVKQAVMYTCAFFLTWTFPIIGGMIWKGGTGNPIPYWISILTNIFYPLQGFWNFLFYVRPGIHYVLKSTNKSFIGAVREVTFNGKALAVQRKSNRRSVSIKKSSCRWLPNGTATPDRRNKASHAPQCLSESEDNPETKRTILEGSLDDLEDHRSGPEEIPQESLSNFAVQEKQSGETRDFLQNGNPEGHFESLHIESCVNNDHEGNVNNALLEGIGDKPDFQSSQKRQQRRSSFFNLASVLCEANLDLDSNSDESSDKVSANYPQELEQAKMQNPK